MENLILSVNVVLPLFLCIALGYFLRCVHVLDAALGKSLNKLCFNVFMPIYLFESIYTTDMSAALNVRLIGFVTAGLLGIFAVMLFLIPRLEKENPRRGVMIQAAFRSNFALFGLPVALSLCGEYNAGPTAVLISIVVPAYNVLAVITLEAFRGGKPDLRKIIRGIATNPLIIGTVLGTVLNVLNLSLPSAVHKSISDLGGVATPLALVALGGEFMFKKIRSYAKQLLLIVPFRLIIAPLIMVALGILLGFRNETLVPVLVTFGSPVATSSFTMAARMEGDATLAAVYIVLTTALSIFTMFAFIFVLKQMGFI